MVKVNIRGKEIEIDDECVNLVEYFNSIGLDTKFCCSGHGKDTFEIMFEDYITDKQIEDFLLKNTIEFKSNDFIYVHSYFTGRFEKWCRVMTGNIKYNWTYSAKDIESAKRDYLRMKDNIKL